MRDRARHILELGPAALVRIENVRAFTRPYVLDVATEQVDLTVDDSGGCLPLSDRHIG